MAKVALNKLDRITATICRREINSQNDGNYPNLTLEDTKHFYMIDISPDGGVPVYALSKGQFTLVMRAIETDKPTKSLLDYKWIKW